MDQASSGYWLDKTVAEIITQIPEGPITVASGVSPSGLYHIGHFREVLTADALAWGLRQAGRQAKHLHFVDNFDPLRKRYSFLPESFEQYVGWPICLVPDPHDCHANYAKHFFAEFEATAKSMGVDMEVVFSYEDQYQNGKMVPMIEAVLEKADRVRKIFADVAGRELPADWTAVQVPDDKKVFINASLKSWDKAKQTIAGIDYTKGEVKLNWRLDWPARWALWNVGVEPYGKEHATKGGSYDTGAQFISEVFGKEPPFPLPYDTINLKGDNKKMSSSLGNVITPKQALDMMPAEVIRYFVLRSKPSRVVYFDTGLGLYNLIEEYSKIEEHVQAGQEHEFAEAYKLAVAGAKVRTISSVPFSHMVSVYQAALGDFDQIIEILERTGYEAAVKNEKDILKREAAYVKNWLDKYAPEEVKFEVQKSLPAVSLTDPQKKFLQMMAVKIGQERDLSGQGMHDLIYEHAEVAGKPSEAFQAIYRVILGKDSGPKAGWFLASLDRDFLIKRLQLEA